MCDGIIEVFVSFPSIQKEIKRCFKIVREYPLYSKTSAINWFYILKFVTGKSNADRITVSSKNNGMSLVGTRRDHFVSIWSQ